MFSRSAEKQTEHLILQTYKRPYKSRDKKALWHGTFWHFNSRPVQKNG